MKSLFEPASAAEIKKRVEALRPANERQWGAMNVAQMLAHCSAWMEMAAGRNTPPRSFVGRIFGKMAKKSVLGEKPISRNMPTDKSLLMKGEKDFAAEQRRLLELVGDFSAGGADRCTTQPHCFFGYLTPDEWAIMGYKHLDHHLKQFGA